MLASGGKGPWTDRSREHCSLEKRFLWELSPAHSHTGFSSRRPPQGARRWGSGWGYVPLAASLHHLWEAQGPSGFGGGPVNPLFLPSQLQLQLLQQRGGGRGGGGSSERPEGPNAAQVTMGGGAPTTWEADLTQAWHSQHWRFPFCLLHPQGQHRRVWAGLGGKPSIDWPGLLSSRHPPRTPWLTLERGSHFLSEKYLPEVMCSLPVITGEAEGRVGREQSHGCRPEKQGSGQLSEESSSGEAQA